MVLYLCTVLYHAWLPEVVLVTKSDSRKWYFICVHQLHIHNGVVLEEVKCPLTNLQDEDANSCHHTSQPQKSGEHRWWRTVMLCEVKQLAVLEPRKETKAYICNLVSDKQRKNCISVACLWQPGLQGHCKVLVIEILVFLATKKQIVGKKQKWHQYYILIWYTDSCYKSMPPF